MAMKEYLESVIARCDATLADLKERNAKAETVEEARSIGARMQEVMVERAEAQRELDSVPTEVVEERGLNPLASYGMKRMDQTEDVSDVRSSMEYRKAFMDYVQKGTMSDILMRADFEHVSGDLGILLPNTIIQDLIKGVEKVYGQIYSKVRKTNVKGGIQYATGEFSAQMYWDGMDGNDKEHGVTENQKTGEVKPYISFTYHIGEIRIAQSLLQTVVTVQAFETEIVAALLEAYVRTMDEMVLLGDGIRQPEGIFTEAAKPNSRISSDNIITFTASEMKNWKSWQRNLFSKIPLSMRNLRPEFVMTAETFESNIMTLSDNNNQPVYRETYNPVTGDESATFKGRAVTFVEESEAIKSFDSAQPGEYFGMYWVPEKAYLVNTNMQFSYKKYFDDKTNQYITKAIVICDGKILDPKYIYLLKKAE